MNMNGEQQSGRGGLHLLDRIVGRVEAFALGWAILVLAAFTVANVAGRFLFDESIFFIEELSEFLMVLITFFGLGYVTRKGRHIRMTAIYDQLPPRGKKVVMIVIAAVTAAVMFVMAWYALEYVQRTAARGKMTPALQVPLYLTYVPVVLGFFLSGVQYLLTVLRNLDFGDPRVFASFSALDEYEDPELAHVLQHGPADSAEAGIAPALGEQRA